MDYDESDQKPVIPDWIAKSGWLKAEEEPVFSDSADGSATRDVIYSPTNETTSEPELPEFNINDQVDSDSADNTLSSINPNDKIDAADIVISEIPSEEKETQLLNQIDITEPVENDDENEDPHDLPDWLKKYEPGLREVDNETIEEIKDVELDVVVPESTLIPPPIPTTEPPSMEENLGEDSMENAKDATVATEEVEESVPDIELQSTDLGLEPSATTLDAEVQATDELESALEVQQVDDQINISLPVITSGTILDSLRQGDFAKLPLLAREYELSDQPIDELITRVKEESGDLGERNEYWRFLGDLLDHNGQFDEAIDAFRKAETILLK